MLIVQRRRFLRSEIEDVHGTLSEDLTETDIRKKDTTAVQSHPICSLHRTKKWSLSVKQMVNINTRICNCTWNLSGKYIQFVHMCDACKQHAPAQTRLLDYGVFRRWTSLFNAANNITIKHWTHKRQNAWIRSGDSTWTNKNNHRSPLKQNSGCFCCASGLCARALISSGISAGASWDSP